MKITTKEEYTNKKMLMISTDNGMTFLSFSFYNIFRGLFEKDNTMSGGSLINLRFEVDVAIPGIEFFFCLFGFTVFFRHNTKDSEVVFEKFNKQIEEAIYSLSSSSGQSSSSSEENPLKLECSSSESSELP